MSQPREPRDEDPTTEYVRSALHEAAQSYRPGRTAMVDRVAAGRAAPPRPAPRRSPRSFLSVHPVAAAVAVAAVLAVSVVAVRSGADHDQPTAAPPPAAALSPTAVATTPARPTTTTTTTKPHSSPASAHSAANGFLSTKGAVDPHSVPTWAQHNVTITNTKALASLRVTITIAATDGASAANKFTTVPNADLTMAVTPAGKSLIYTYVLRDGATLRPGKYVFAAQFNHRAGRTADQDSYTVVARTGSAGAELAGRFGVR
jgi:hypothetical protein